MSIHNLRKALGLLIVDIVIIIGIFVLQFRTDSSIIEKLGQLTITMEKKDADSINATSPDTFIELNNKFQISYNGLNFFCDDQNPVRINSINDSSKGADAANSDNTIKLLSFSKKNDSSVVFKFTKDVAVTVEISSFDSDANLFIMTSMPSDIKSVYIPFNYSYNMKIKKSESDCIIFDTKKQSWELSGLSFADGYAGFSHNSPGIAYSTYTDVQKFTFESIVDLPIASEDLFATNIAAIKNNLISSFSSVSENNLSEQTVVSYVAAMAEQGNYAKAIDNIPASFKHGKDRTYLSTPYLNTLSDMDDILQKTIKLNEGLISKSANSGSLDIFGIRNLAAYLCIHPKQSEVVSILTNASNLVIENCNLTTAIGILQVYEDLYTFNKDYAAILEPILDECIEKITAMSSMNGNILTISENDTFLSVIQSVEIGITVLRYGQITSNNTMKKAGYALVNSYISESSSFDARTLSNIYSIIAYDNTYYPHFKKIEINKYNNIWAWTCAKDISITTHTNDDLVINVDFPEGWTHYIIMKGIPRFHTIYIYNMAFRTDPRFETYNSSGYVYKRETKTLLLKSRHKSRMEEVRLEIGDEPVVVHKPEPAKPKEEPKPAETTEVKETPEEVPAKSAETNQATEGTENSN